MFIELQTRVDNIHENVNCFLRILNCFFFIRLITKVNAIVKSVWLEFCEYDHAEPRNLHHPRAVPEPVRDPAQTTPPPIREGGDEAESAPSAGSEWLLRPQRSKTVWRPRAPPRLTEGAYS